MGLAYGVEVASSRALVVTPGKVITPDMRTIQLLPSMPGATAPKSTQEYIANRSVASPSGDLPHPSSPSSYPI